MDINNIRKDTPGVNQKLFVNSAGSSLVPRQVHQTVLEYLEEEQMVGGYWLADKNSERIGQFYTQAAQLINGQPHQIAFTTSATDAYIKALSSVPLKSGDLIVTTDDDYISNFMHFYSLQDRMGIKVKRIKNVTSGELDLQHLEEMITNEHPKLVAITHVPTNSGLIQPVEAVGQLCEKYDVLFLLDACQAIGQLDVDVTKVKCDFLSATGRKFLRGPRGTGFLYVSEKALESQLIPLYFDMRGAKWVNTEEYQLENGAKRFELWEINYALLLGLSEAIKYCNQVGLRNIENHNASLRNRLVNQMLEIPGINLYDQGVKKANIITFKKEGVSNAMVGEHLRNNKVYFSISNRSNALIDFDKKGIDGAVRLSPHYFNTIDEMDQLAEIIRKIN